MNKCSICLEQLTDLFLQLRCNHTYHKKCFKKYINQGKNNYQCCICRATVNSDFIKENNLIEPKSDYIDPIKFMYNWMDGVFDIVYFEDNIISINEINNSYRSGYKEIIKYNCDNGNIITFDVFESSFEYLMNNYKIIKT